MEESFFIAIDEKGNEVECEELFRFESEETKKSYIVYTDNTTDDEGNTKVYASSYTLDDEKMLIKPLETEKEWKTVEIILNSIQEELKKGNKNEQ